MKSSSEINYRGPNIGTKRKISANNQPNQARQEPNPFTFNLRRSLCLDSRDIPRNSRHEDLYANTAMGSFCNENHGINAFTDIGSSTAPRCITDGKTQDKILQVTPLHSENSQYQC